jgi:hypothetical protein
MHITRNEIGASDRPFDDIATSMFSRPPATAGSSSGISRICSWHRLEVGNGEQIELKAILGDPAWVQLSNGRNGRLREKALAHRFASLPPRGGFNRGNVHIE